MKHGPARCSYAARGRAWALLVPLVAACSRNAPRGPPVGQPGTLPIEEIRRVAKAAERHTVFVPASPLGIAADLEPLVPANNPLTEAKVELGRQLFFDPRLSSDGSVACASCHHPSTGWARNERLSRGVDGATGARNAPAVFNRILGIEQGWSGRARTLEEQVMLHLSDPEMGGAPEDIGARLAEIEGYRLEFESVYGGPPAPATIAKSIAAFTRTILAGQSDHDFQPAPGDAAGTETGEPAPDPEAEHRLSPSALRGRDLFFGKARCSLCHSGDNLTDERYHNTGIGMQAARPDLGRHLVTGNDAVRGAFKTPTVRDVARTAPYMHDGSLITLLQVVEHYDRGGTPNPWLSEEIVPLGLTREERIDLVLFLEQGLASAPAPSFELPRLP